MRKRNNNNKRKKEEIAEDWCFICKDGGDMRVCDYRDCLKAYHALCVKQDDSFLEEDSNWYCGSHYCYLCTRASKFMCLCCPYAVCEKCKYIAEFATVKRNKGFCGHCSKLAFLIETNADVDSDGEKIDMKDPDTQESYFLEYYEDIKTKEVLTSQQVHSARDFIKNRKNKCGLDPYEIDEEEDDSGESDVSNFLGSDCDDLDDTARVKSVRRKKCMKKLKSINGTVMKDAKKDFVGWGSRSLIDFLEYIGHDTTNEISEHDVTSIVINYCHKNKLFDPKKKRTIICDAKLRTLLRKKSVNKNNIHKLLASHFVENVEETDYIISDSEKGDDNGLCKLSKQINLNSTTKACHNLVSEEIPSCFAAINSSNLKLVYLKRSLIEELLKQPETFDGKVLGSFVRTKSDPNDYLQKNSHLLLQVIGINRSSKTGKINQEILLRLSNVPKDVPISKISDDDFSEEECQDLYQRVKNGLLKQPTIPELEQKARTLHEDMIKHWISREIALLRNRIDLANEKGWRRELAQYMDRKLKLESPSEQSRLLSEIPTVIPEMIYTNLSPKYSSRKDKLEQNDLPELAIGKTCNSVGQYSTQDGVAQCLDMRTDVVGPKPPVKNNQDDAAFSATVEQLSVLTASKDKDTSPKKPIQYTLESLDDGKPALLKGSDSDGQTLNPAKCGLPQPTATISTSADLDCKNLSANMDTNKTVNERQTITVMVADPVKMNVNDVKANINDVIVLSDCDLENANVKITLARKGLESPDSSADVDCKNLSANKDTNMTVNERQSITVTVADPVKATVNDVIVLSDSEDEGANVKVTLARKGVESPDISMWHCSGIYGSATIGPFSMSILKQWSESESSVSPLNYKVWKTGESEREAMLLRDALRLFFP